MKLKASIAVAVLAAVGMSTAAGAGAQTCRCRCPAAHHARHAVKRATSRTVIVEERYSRASPASDYDDEPYAPPGAYDGPPPADAYYEPPAYDYAPVLTSYGYGAYAGPYSGWRRRVGGGARWGDGRGVFVGHGPGVGRQVAIIARGPGVGGHGGVMVGGRGR